MVKKVNTGKPDNTGNSKGDDSKAKKDDNTASQAPKQEIFYKLLRERTAEDRLPKQAQVIMDTLASMSGSKDGVSRADLVKELSKEDSGLQTKQPVERIVSYYQAKLQSMGLIEHGRRAV